MTQSLEYEAADEGAHDPQDDVHHQPFAAAIDDQTADPASDQAHHEPSNNAHFRFPRRVAALGFMAFAHDAMLIEGRTSGSRRFSNGDAGLSAPIQRG